MLTETKQNRYSNWLIWGLAVLLALGLLAVLVPRLASAAAPAKYDEDDCDYIHSVKIGNTLASIAKAYGTDARQIVYINEMDPPYTIYLGQRLCIPEKDKKGLSKLASKYATAVAVYFTAGRQGDDILVYTYNYPKTSVIVRGENAGASGWKLVDIGKINIASVGNRKTIRFRLPTELRVKKLLICLKDKKTGYLQCVTPRTGG
jgi:hypothetical protein